MYYVKPSALLPGKAICWIELIAGNNSKMKRSRRHVPFSLSLAGVSVLLVVLCGILFQNANSHVIPNKSIAKSLTKTDAPVKVEMEYGKHGLNVVGELQSSREKSREKRWAFPADIQDIPCEEGYIRRLDGKCIAREGKDDYDSEER